MRILPEKCCCGTELPWESLDGSEPTEEGLVFENGEYDFRGYEPARGSEGSETYTNFAGLQTARCPACGDDTEVQAGDYPVHPPGGVKFSQGGLTGLSDDGMLVISRGGCVEYVTHSLDKVPTFEPGSRDAEAMLFALQTGARIAALSRMYKHYPEAAKTLIREMGFEEEWLDTGEEQDGVC